MIAEYTQLLRAMVAPYINENFIRAYDLNGGALMQMTLKKLVDVAQGEPEDHEKLGKELAVAMAQDHLSYHDAHCKLHHLMKVLEKAEKFIGKAAFKELSRDERPIDMAFMTEIQDSRY